MLVAGLGSGVAPDLWRPRSPSPGEITTSTLDAQWRRHLPRRGTASGRIRRRSFQLRLRRYSAYPGRGHHQYLGYPKSKGGSLVTVPPPRRPARILRLSRSSAAARSILNQLVHAQNPKPGARLQPRVPNSLIGGLRVTRMRPPAPANLVDGDRQRSDTDRPGSDSGTFTIKMRKVVCPIDVVLDGPGSTIPTDHTHGGRVWTWSVANMELRRFQNCAPGVPGPRQCRPRRPGNRRMMRSESGNRIRASRDALLKLLLAGAPLLTLTAGGARPVRVFGTREAAIRVSERLLRTGEPPDDVSGRRRVGTKRSTSAIS